MYVPGLLAMLPMGLTQGPGDADCILHKAHTGERSQILPISLSPGCPEMQNFNRLPGQQTTAAFPKACWKPRQPWLSLLLNSPVYVSFFLLVMDSQKKKINE